MTDRPRSRRATPRPGTGAPALSISIRTQSRQWRALPDLRARATQAAQAALRVSAVAPPPGAELSLLLTDDRRMRSVNRQWRGFDKATNVLSFPAAPPEAIARSPGIGDIVVAFETTAGEAQAEGKSLEAHFSHLVIHGMLHLLGEDHETEDQARRMEGLEVAALATLGIADPYADTEPLAPSPEPATATRPPHER